MATLLVGFDLDKPGQDYTAIGKRLRSCEAWWHHLDSTWLVRTELTVVQLREELRQLIDKNDKVLVIDVSGRFAAWSGFNERGSNWLKNLL